MTIKEKRSFFLPFVLLMTITLAGLLIPIGTTYAKSHTSMVHQSSHVAQFGTYGLPSWWNKATCDDTNYFKAVHIHPYLITSWRGIQVCGPRPYTVSTPDNYVTFPGGSTEQEFECVELVKRYIYLAYGLNALGGTSGYQLVDKYTTTYSGTFHKVLNNGSVHLAPVEGDVFSYGANDPGHTSIVTSSSVDGNGNGSINVIEENVGASGTARLTMSNWVIQHDSYHIGTVASWMTTRSLPATNTVVNFSVTMPSIGTGGNTNPLHKTRQATLAFLNSSGNVSKTVQASANYSNGVYSGTVNLGTTLSSGSYQLKIRLSNTLYKTYPGFFSAGTTVNEAAMQLVSGDINMDNQINVLDYNMLIGCYGTKITTSSCIDKISGSDMTHNSDLDDDGTVGSVDYNIYLRGASVQHGS